MSLSSGFTWFPIVHLCSFKMGFVWDVYLLANMTLLSLDGELLVTAPTVTAEVFRQPLDTALNRLHFLNHIKLN